MPVSKAIQLSPDTLPAVRSPVEVDHVDATQRTGLVAAREHSCASAPVEHSEVKPPAMQETLLEVREQELVQAWSTFPSPRTQFLQLRPSAR